jgi:TBP-interacting protein
MAEIKEIPGRVSRFERVGAHTHIKGLGLDSNLKAIKIKDGMVGQEKAREAAGLVVQMIRQGKLSGRLIILAGPPGTGKTAIAIAIARELGSNIPFIQLSGGEIYSTEKKKTEVLMEGIRKCIGVEIHEQREVYEGEVKSLDVKLVPHPYNPYQRVPESVRLTLKTTKEERSIEAGSSVAQQIINQGISEGDVIQIDAETGRVVNLGVSMEHSKSKLYEVGSERRVPRPDGQVKKQKEFVYMLTLHDMDEMVARRQGSGLISLFFGASESKEISPDVRASVDQEVKEMVDQGKAFIHPGVLFIDDSHLLDLEAFSFLGRALESELVPIVILATNRGITKIRGTDVESPFGFPLDLIDRSVIIVTEPYDRESIREILKIRANEEKVKIAEQALELLSDIGEKTSLRYSVQLLSLAAQNANTQKKDTIDVEDVRRVEKLFSDVSEATDYLRRYEERLLKH